MNRRDMLKLTGTGLAAAMLPEAALAGPRKTQPKIALQLYSVRNHSKKDFDKTLEDVAKLGYKAVEFAGYFKYGGKGRDLKKRLDSLGLKAAGTHIGTGSFTGNIQRTIDFHSAIGCKYLIVPGDGRFAKSDDSNKQYAEIMNDAARKLKPHGLRCGYHNHTKEFKKVGNKTYWDLFAERTTKDVVLQQDIGWSTHARQVPADLVRRYPGRHQIVHCKPTIMHGDKGKQPFIGQDSVDWPPVLKALMEVGDCEWLTIETERVPKGMSQMECAGKSLVGLKKIMATL